MHSMKRLQYTKILVPVDGSKFAEKALLHACELAKNYHSKITLIYVVDKSHTINLLDKKEYLAMVRKFGDKVIKKSLSLTVQNGIDAKHVIKEGNVADEIINLAKKDNTNLIVMGSRGLGKTLRLFLGSISNKIVNNSPCSVLIIKN